MSPIDYTVIESKRDFLIKELDVLNTLDRTKVTSGSDILIKHALARSMEISVMCIIDLSQHIIIDKLKKTPESYYDAIYLLGEAKILEPKFAERFAGCARLRNVLAHAYLNLDVEILASQLPQFIADIKTFLKELEKI